MLEVTLLSCWEMKLSFMLEKAISCDASENLDLTFRASENAQIPLNICFQCALLRCSVMSDSPQSRGLWPTRLFCPWNFPGRSTGAGCHFLLFPDSGMEPTSPSLAGRFFTTEPPGKPHILNRPREMQKKDQRLN